MRLALKPHPETSSGAVASIEVEIVQAAPARLTLRYLVAGVIGDLLLPRPAAPERADGLWQHTCFEAFLRQPEDATYCEFNFAPSRQWATYAFDGYRSGMKNLPIEPPRIEVSPSADMLEVSVELQLAARAPLQLALSAVIEERGGRKSYWALRHPAGKADFHHPDSFACELS